MATFTNIATLTYNGITTESNVATGQLVENATLTKTPVVDEYTPGGRVTYVMSLVNTGTTPLTGLTITDNLGAYDQNGTTRYPLAYTVDSIQYYINGAPQAAPAVTAGPPMTITGLSVPVGGNATIIFDTTITGTAPLGTTANIVNTATLTGDDIETDVVATATVAAAADPTLAVSKAMNPTTVTPGDALTYSFTLQNTGASAADAADDLILTDTFDPNLTNITVAFNNSTLVAGTDYTYNEATGEFATVQGRLTVPAASYVQDPTSGNWIITPGTSLLTVTGTV